MIKIQRTVSIKLKDFPDTISDTFQAYTNALNYIAKIAIEEKLCFSPFKLQKRIYHKVRKKFGLKSQMTINAIRLVTSTFKSAWKNKRFKLPNFSRKSILLNYPRDFKIINRQYLSLNTIYGRQKVEFVSGDHQRRYLDGSWQIGSGHLIKKRTGYYFNISVSKEIEDVSLQETVDVIGVDIGQRYLAVVSALDSRCKFFKGRELKHKKERFCKTRAGLQSKGTRSSKRVLQRLSGRERRWQTDVNHVVSKQIVEFAKGHRRPIIVMEDLKGIRKAARQRKEQRYFFHSWAFNELQRFIEYKAQAVGTPVFKIKPEYTSQVCPKCEHLTKSNGLQFICSFCGFSLHRDLLGSRNIATKFVVNRQALIGNGLQSTSPEVASVDVKGSKKQLRRSSATSS